MDLVSKPVRLVASAVDVACAGFVAFYVYLVLDLFGAPPGVSGAVVAAVFVSVRLLSAALLDVDGRGTPGRMLLSAGVVDWRGDPVALKVALGRRALADVWIFGSLAAGLGAAAFRAGAGPADFAVFDWLVALLVSGDLVFFGSAAVWHASGGWAFPHDYVFGTLMEVADRGLLVSPDRDPALQLPKALADIPGLKARPHLQSLWKELLAASPEHPAIDLATAHLPRLEAVEELR